jgi:hypothetical protein
MASSRVRKDSAPQVTAEESASLGRVGIIALVGFVIGVAWPRLAGVSLVPEAPVDEDSFGDAPAAAAAESATGPSEPEVIELTPEDRLAIGPAQVTSCVDKEGKKGASCDKPAIDEIVHPHLIALLGCPAAAGVFGTLSLGFQLDFEAGKVFDPISGRSTDVPETTKKELLLCAKKEFEAIKIPPLPHEYSGYQVYYSLEFKTPEAAAEEKSSVTPASGQATIQWRSAQIRKEPEQGSDVQSRLLAGARVIVTGRMGEWYRVKYDARGREGWIHGAALGLK